MTIKRFSRRALLVAGSVAVAGGATAVTIAQAASTPTKPAVRHVVVHSGRLPSRATARTSAASASTAITSGLAVFDSPASAAVGSAVQDLLAQSPIIASMGAVPSLAHSVQTVSGTAYLVPTSNGACIMFATAGSSCDGASATLSGHNVTWAPASRGNKTQVAVAGLVPNGVTSVTVTGGGSSTTVPVTDNSYSATVSAPFQSLSFGPSSADLQTLEFSY